MPNFNPKWKPTDLLTTDEVLFLIDLYTRAGGDADNVALTTDASTGAIIAASDSGDHQHYTLAEAATTTAYYAIINNGSYSADDSAFGFTVSGSALVFNSPLPSDLAATIIKLVCV